jgi:mono/diheme cytochrome c family protein
MAKRLVWVGIVMLALGAGAALVTRGIGYTARAVPSAFEVRLMRGARHWGTPVAVRDRANPLPATDGAVQAAMAHWADHCAGCHGNDGRGTGLGRSVYPPVPDMRDPQTQAMSDGELYYVIERGIPLSGMPAWGNGTPDGEEQSWALVRFIRHLPLLTDQEVDAMEKLNPKSAAQIELERKMNDFLNRKAGQ